MNGRQMTPGLLAQDAAATAQPMPGGQPPERDWEALLDALTIGFGGMSLRPNEGLIRMAQERMKERSQGRQRNRTADWLESQGLGAYADAVRSGALSAGDAIKLSRGEEATAAQRNYQFLISQGVDPETAMQRAFAGGTTINMPGGAMPGLGKLSTDYSYVMDAQGNPVVDPQTGLPLAAPVPGSPAAREIAQAEEKAAERERVTAATMGTTLENLNLNIQEIEDKGWPVTGLVGSVTSLIPGTAARDFAVRQGQITTRAALDEVQRMRDNSPTGGAVGELTDGERVALGEAATSLSQATSGPEYLRAARNFRKLMLDLAYGEGKWSLTPEGRVSLTPGQATPGTGGAGMTRESAVDILMGQ